jgi:phage major head subunit gpT-like protein
MAITINGTGTITGISVGGLPDATITQAEIATGVGGTGPAFSAYASAAQSIANNTSTILNVNTELFDTASCYNNTGSTVGSIPAYSFLPNVAGYYQVNAAWYSAPTAGQVQAIIYKNGSQYQITAITFGSAGQVLGVNCLVYLNGSSDYIGFYVNQAQGSAYTTLASRADLYYFAASMVRSA